MSSYIFLTKLKTHDLYMKTLAFSLFLFALALELELESKMKILYDAVFKFFRQKLVFKLAQYSFWDALIKRNGKTYN